MQPRWDSIASVKAFLEKQQKDLGPCNLEVATILTRLGDLCFVEEQYSQAEECYWHALEIRQKLCGEVHDDVAASLKNLAELYEILDRYAESERFYQWHLEIRKKVKLEQHSDRLDSTSEVTLPAVNTLREAETCKQCSKPLLDSAFCMYCTKGVDFAELMEIARKAEAKKAGKSAAKPVNCLIEVDSNSRYRLTDIEIPIGRHPSNIIILRNDAAASRHHAVVRYEAGSFHLQDCRTLNGTFLNGSRIEGPRVLNAGDEIRIGQTTLLAEFEAEAN